MSQEIPNVQAGFRKEKRIRDQVAKICWLDYRDSKGRKKNISLGKNLLNDPTKVDTMTLIPTNAPEGVDYFEFPCNEFNAGTSSTLTQLVLAITVGSRETEFDRTFRIDQVFLEPVTE